MHSEFFPRTLISLALLIACIAFGIILHRTGRPYGVLLFNLHKFATLGLVVYVVLGIVRFSRMNGTTGLLMLFMVLSALFLLILLASGAFLSLDKYFTLMQKFHKIAGAGFVISLAGLFYKLLA